MAAGPYRVLVTGSRTWRHLGVVFAALAEARQQAAGRPLIVVHGDCPTGADRIAKAWVRRQQGSGVGEEPHPAEDHGPWPACGPRRNAHMVSLGADEALAFIGPCTSPRCRRPRPHGSHGATGCALLAERAGIPTRRWTS